MTTTRTALITGASAGLGTEFARQLAHQGYDLILVARRLERLESLAQEMRDTHGVWVQTIAADLSTPGAPAAIEGAAERSVDYLVNNAGASGPNLLEDRDWPEQEAFLRLMMLSVAEMCHRFIPLMIERRWGRVINVASMAGRVARSAGANYGPSKAYVIAVSEELALMAGDAGVKISALCPGFTHTDFHETGGLQEMKKGLPGWLWYNADVVVREGLEAVERGQAVMLSGRIYRWLDPIVRSALVRPFIKRAGR